MPRSITGPTARPSPARASSFRPIPVPSPNRSAPMFQPRSRRPQNRRSPSMAANNDKASAANPGRPIGVFDSGIGGLTVVKALRDLLPNEDVFYVGDTARVPYGNKSAETVERYSIELANMLVRADAKVIVVACNTVSSVAIPKLRAHV